MSGSARPANIPAFLVTIDTEGDNIWGRPKKITTQNAAYIPRFQSLCERYCLKPTYLTNWEMASSSCFVDFARHAQSQGTAEIGMHLHAWNSPPIYPLTSGDDYYLPYAIEYPRHILYEKVHRLTEKLEETFQAKMTSHRAGRWALNELYAKVLVKNGYLVDCSVTPHVTWKAKPGVPGGGGGCDYSDFPENAYFVNTSNIAQSGDSTLLEVPMTIVSRKVSMARRISNRLRKRSMGSPILWLRPRGNNLEEMLSILHEVRADGRQFVEFMLHSSELMPGGAPRFWSAEDIEALYEDLESFFDAARGLFVGMTLTEFYHHLKSNHQ